MSEQNAREKLLAVANWLGWQDENLSEGLKSPEDAIRLYDYWVAHDDDLPEMADEYQDDEGRFMCVFREGILGYDPLSCIEESLEDLAVAKYEADNASPRVAWDGIRPHIQKMYIEDVKLKLRKEYGIV